MTPAEDLYPWDVQISENGSFIIRSRYSFVEFLNERLSQYYDHISDKEEEICTIYRSNVLDNADKMEIDAINEAFRNSLTENREKDIILQNTHIGPHREDLEFIKDGQPLRSFGSQGENKTFLIALKFAESDYIKMKTNKKPLLLLDDIFGELDNYRTHNLITYVKNVGQTFITTTLRDKFGILDTEDSQLWHMKEGMIYEA
jgi:DNA replication and repair protein RecF